MKKILHKVGWVSWLKVGIGPMDGLIIVQKTLKIPDPIEVSHIPNVHPIEMAERENKGGDYQQSLAPWGRL